MLMYLIRIAESNCRHLIRGEAFVINPCRELSISMTRSLTPRCQSPKAVGKLMVSNSSLFSINSTHTHKARKHSQSTSVCLATCSIFPQHCRFSALQTFDQRRFAIILYCKLFEFVDKKRSASSRFPIY